MFAKLYAYIKNFIKENFRFLLLLTALYLVFNIELPYVIYSPGGYISLNDRVVVEGGYESEGELGMAYVSQIRPSIPFVLASFIIPNWDLQKASEVTLENESIEDMNAREKMYLENAIDSAIIASFTLTENDVEIIDVQNHIEYITGSAQTTLELGDIILSVDGMDYENIEELSNYIQTLNVGDTVSFTVLRDEKEKKATAKIYEEEGKKMVGLMSIPTYEYETDPDVDVKFKASEAGPSGGLMTALSIYNALVKEDITGGKKIIGTGTIDLEGNVGEIGGVKYKLIGAVKKDAEVFLCPKENLEEALKLKIENDYDIKIIGVATLQDAIKALQEVK